MKRKRVDIKKQIEKEHERYVYIKKRNDRSMDEFSNTMNARSAPKSKKIDVGSISNKDRTAIRAGNYVNPNTVEHLPVLENKEPISIIVTAYQTQDFIEECLDSIEAQTYFENNDNYEILVGIDGCEETLNKLLGIRHKYRNLRIFMMKKNVGTFITTNTLIDIMKTNNYIRFDSDDIMIPEMVNEIMYYSNDFDIIKFSYFNFNINGYNRLKTVGNRYAAGVIFFKKRVFDLYGGYQPWICTAEGEILIRIGNDLNVKEIDWGLFKRRVHKNSLTQKNETGMFSDIRKEYHKMIIKNQMNGIKKIKRITGEYYEIKEDNS